jgi:hypothetical protein
VQLKAIPQRKEKAMQDFIKGFWIGFKGAAKVLATGCLVTLGIAMCFSFLGMLMAPRMVHDGMSLLWGSVDEE